MAENHKSTAGTAPRSFLRTACLSLLSAAVLALLVRHLGGTGELLEALESARPQGLAAAVATLAACIFTAALRWRLVLCAMGHPISQRRSIEIVLATMPFSIVAPSRANDLLRAQALRHEVPALATVGSVLAERAMDVQVLCVLAGVGALLIDQRALAIGAFSAAALEWMIMILALRATDALGALPRFQRQKVRLDQLRRACSMLAKRPRMLAAVATASLTAWCLNVVLLQTFLFAFSSGLGGADTLALWPIALFVGLVPVSLGGLGTRDAAFLFLVHEFGHGQTADTAVVASTLGYAFASTWLLALVGIPFSLRHLAISK